MPHRIAALVILLLPALVVAQTLPLAVPRRLLVFAPHPDDAMLAAGLTHRVLASGGEVRVVDMTSGDARSPVAERYMRQIGWNVHANTWMNYGLLRQHEDRAAVARLGLAPAHLSWLGYPDGSIAEMLARWRRGDARPVTSRSTGASAVPYATAVSPGAPYVLDAVIADLARALASFRPDMLIVMHPNDNHPDHAATWYIGQEALVRSGLDPARVAVRVPLDAYGAVFPLRLRPGFTLRAPGRLPSATRWFELELERAERDAKVALIGSYPSQMAWEHPTQSVPQGTRSYMYGYAAANELYGEVLEVHHDEVFRRLINAREMARRVAGAAANVVHDTVSRCAH